MYCSFPYYDAFVEVVHWRIKLLWSSSEMLDEISIYEKHDKELMERPVILRWREDKETVKADGEVEDVKVNDQAEGVTVDDSGEVEGEDKQE
uniref:Uncharacterized protein n=1 Tax=Aegilops tauschii subsp. strangulata TaxID=200361 RepID=A0A453CWH5_AEGTS